jgi:hypothetical protein
VIGSPALAMAASVGVAQLPSRAIALRRWMSMSIAAVSAAV